jgi:predicted PurR-regulated permease PerM
MRKAEYGIMNSIRRLFFLKPPFSVPKHMTHGTNAGCGILCLYFAIWRHRRATSRPVVAAAATIITNGARFDIDPDYYDELKIPENLSIDNLQCYRLTRHYSPLSDIMEGTNGRVTRKEKFMENATKQSDHEFSNDKAVSVSLKIGFVALLLILSYLILKPFLVMVLWAIIIAVGIYPIFRRLSSHLGNRDKLASVLIGLAASAIIIVPSILLLGSTINSIKTINAKYEAGTLSISPPSKDVAEWPVVGKPIYETWKLASVNLDAALKALEPQIKKYGPKIVEGVAGLGGTILLSIISIVIACVLVLKSESSEKTAQKVFKLCIGKDGEEFTHLAGSTIRSVVQGVLGVAIIQSAAAGILMRVFGMPAAGLLALVVLIVAIMQIPLILILLPVSIYGFSMMGTTPAVIFLVLSVLISISDTFLKPLFLGRGVDVPMLVILLGAIGGMMAFGILGLFVGAVILATAYKIYQILTNEDTN